MAADRKPAVLFRNYSIGVGDIQDEDTVVVNQKLDLLQQKVNKMQQRIDHLAQNQAKQLEATRQLHEMLSSVLQDKWSNYQET